MSRQRKEPVVASLVAASTLLLLLWSFPSVAAGPEPIGGGVSSPIGSNVGKPAPAGTLPAGPVRGVAPKGPFSPRVAAPPAQGKSAALPAEPKWPQNFELGVGERTGFPFVVGQPGPIVVTVKWQGGPLGVTLAKPGRGAAADRSGSGAVMIKYTATADDVRKGVLWGVALRSAQGGTNPAMAAGGKKRYQVAAKGTVSVQHPPGDMNRAQAELNALAAKAKAEQSKPKPPGPPQADALAQAKAGLQRQQAARQAQLLERIRPKIPAEAFRKISGKISAGANPVGGGAQKPQPVATGQAPSGQSATAVAASKTFGPAKGPRTAVEVPGLTLVPTGGGRSPRPASRATREPPALRRPR